jgi:hypothetical protein
MIAIGGIWDGIQDVLAKGFTKSNADWFEHTLGIKSDKFLEHVAVEAIAVLSATTIIGFIGFIGSRHVWRAIRRRFRAATIRKTSSAAFVIVRCPIANDSNEAIGNEIAARLETAFRAFAGWGETGGRSFHVMSFPLALSGDEGTKTYDKAIETAKRWLERTDGDILIWGKRVKGESVGIVRLIGKNRKKGVIEVRRVDFDRRAADFDQALANAIAYEAAQLTQATLAEPELLNLETLREVSSKLKKLAASDAPALSDKWHEKMAGEHWRLTEEIVRRTPSPEEREKFEAQARLEIAALNPVEQPRRFAETALRVGTLARKRNWVDPNPTELDEARAFLSKAREIFEATHDIRRAAEAAIERVNIRRQQRRFLRKQEREKDTIYAADSREARRLAELADDEGLDARLAAQNCNSSDKDVARMCGLDQKRPAGAFEFVNRVSRYLDNSEFADLAVALGSVLSDEGDRLEDVKFWQATPQISEAILNSRSNWTPDERTFLSALTAGSSDRTASRLRRVVGENAAVPFFEISNRLGKKVLNSLEIRPAAISRYIDFRTLGALGASEFDQLELRQKSLEALRICAGPDAERFPLLRVSAKISLIVFLNNRANRLDSLEAADEALRRLVDLERDENQDRDFNLHYISAYAGWQAARLTPQSDPSSRSSRSSRALSLAAIALQLANEKGNQHFIRTVDELLQDIQADFPELTGHSEVTDAAGRKDLGLPPDSSVTN